MQPLNVAQAFYASNDNGVIIFENLKALGFKVVQKSCKGLDNQCLNKALEILAEFHASGYHLIHSTFDVSVEGFLKKHWPIFQETPLYCKFG